MTTPTAVRSVGTVAGLLGVNDVGPVQSRVTMAFFAICCLLLVAIRRASCRGAHRG